MAWKFRVWMLVCFLNNCHSVWMRMRSSRLNLFALSMLVLLSFLDTGTGWQEVFPFSWCVTRCHHGLCPCQCWQWYVVSDIAMKSCSFGVDSLIRSTTSASSGTRMVSRNQFYIMGNELKRGQRDRIYVDLIYEFGLVDIPCSSIWEGRRILISRLHRWSATWI